MLTTKSEQVQLLKEVQGLLPKTECAYTFDLKMTTRKRFAETTAHSMFCVRRRILTAIKCIVIISFS